MRGKGLAGLPRLSRIAYYGANFLIQGQDAVKKSQNARVPLLLFGLLVFSACENPPGESPAADLDQMAQDYIEDWKTFYPTSAVRLGLDQYLTQTEERTTTNVAEWVHRNEEVLSRVQGAPESLHPDLLIDLRLLRRQVSSEIRLWKEEEALVKSPGMYASVIRGLLDLPEAPKRLAQGEMEGAVINRLMAVPALVEAMKTQLKSGPQGEVLRAMRTMEGMEGRLESLSDRFPGVTQHLAPALEAIQASVQHLEGGIHKEEDVPSFPLGRDRFAQELAVYYDRQIGPEEVAQRALAEIETVRELISETSRAYWLEAHPDEVPPADTGELVRRVSLEMEENRPSTEKEALESFTRFAEEAEIFVREMEIATLPPDRTLEITLTPESAGPSQRIGFVASPPPFDPEPMTLLSLPTIPDSFPEAEKEDFYRSFNNHFNKMIIIHELFPGHYMQLKIASGNPRQVRTFFPYQPYVEGWATLTEKFALDAGWDDFNKLTYLSHLRKRLENANRAYTSVQVHCNGWTEEQVGQFSEEMALLAPQFAKSLFGRLQRGAMQMTSYFMGKDMFMEVLEAEQARLGEGFVVREFTDVILNAGAVPMDMLPELLAGR